MPVNIIHNNVNSNYFIINIKCNFNEILNNSIDIKNKYYIIIQKWIKNILNRYSLTSNWIIYIKNLNFNYFRIFIYLNSLNYSNMDSNNIIYITDMINYENIFKINIKDFIKYFNMSELNVLVDLEFDIISNSLSNSSNSLTDSSNSLTDSSNSLTDSSNSLADSNTEINTFDIIDMHFFEINKPINIDNNNSIHTIDKYEFITDIGISGINKITFFNELIKVLYINDNITNIYSNINHNIYNDSLFTKIKENNMFYWINYDENDIDIKYYLLKVLFNC